MESGGRTLFLDVDVNGELSARMELSLESGRVRSTMETGTIAADQTTTVDIPRVIIILGK